MGWLAGSLECFLQLQLVQWRNNVTEHSIACVCSSSVRSLTPDRALSSSTSPTSRLYFTGA
jgi:hypothetical protein